MYDMPNTLAYYRKFENKQESFTGRGLSKAGAVLRRVYFKIRLSELPFSQTGQYHKTFYKSVACTINILR
jgi:hypothetical protein